MEQDDIIIKIKKLLAVSKSPNQNEAQSALLKVQKLLAKHRLSMREVDNYLEKNIEIENLKTEEKFRGKSWKSNLAGVIANNFGCYVYYKEGHYKVNTICFYGKQEDVTICDIMFNYAVKSINLEGDRLVKKLKSDKRRKYFDGIKNDYALGFIKGLKDRFSEQIRNNLEWGLVLCKEQEVIDSYKNFSAGFGKILANQEFNRHIRAYKRGEIDGKKFDISDKIENEGIEEIQIP